jgi:sigma-54 specific flagellar transcriptional regulator A
VDINELPQKYQYPEGIEPYPSPKLKEKIQKQENQGAETQASMPAKDVIAEIPEEGLNLKKFMAKLEVEYILKALDANDWVVAKAAEQLGMRRTTLVEKMKKYDINRNDPIVENP